MNALASRLKPRHVVAVIIVICLILVVSALALVSARSELLRGAVEVRAAEAAIPSKIEVVSPATIDIIRGHVDRAHSDFAAADARLTPLSTFLTHLGWVPRVGNQLEAAPPAARLADRATSGALSLLTGVQPLLDRSRSRKTGTHLTAPSLLTELASRQTDFSDACVSFSQAAGARRQLGTNLPTALSSAVHSIDKQLPRLITACDVLNQAPTLLGFPHQTTYMVAYQNSNELRATGGFIGSAGLLTVRRGKITERFTGTGLQDNLSYEPPQPMAFYNGEPAWLFRDSNWSPDFPTSAALERFFARLDLSWHARNVIDVTPQALTDVLAAIGPFYSPAYHQEISSANAAALADFYSHHNQGYVGPEHIANGDTYRKQFIGIVARHIFSHLGSLPPGRLLRLALNVRRDMSQGDILMNFGDARQQAVLRSLHATGGINRTTSDYLYVVDSNLSYNKISPYIHLDTSYHVSVRSDRWLDADLSLRLQNVPGPASAYLEGYGPGGGELGTTKDYAGFLRVYVPDGAQIVSQSGWRQAWSSGPAYGKTVFSGYVIVRHGQTRTIHLHYIVPPNVFRWSAGRRYRLVIQHQPGTRPNRVSVAITADGRTSTSVRRFPSTDWTMTVPVRHRPFAPLPLAPNPFPTVAPGHTIEPHVYLGKSTS